MNIRLSKKLKLKIITVNKFKDKRGDFIESYNKNIYFKRLKLNFIEDDFTINKKSVFRGIHGDNSTWKLISCIYGVIESYIVNCDLDSKNFGKWEKFILSDKNYKQILVPPKFGNAYLVKKNNSIYHYKQTKTYTGAKNQFTYKWYDPRINLKIKKPLIISNRDK